MAADTVFLTGGSGFVGHHVGQALLRAGYGVKALARSGGAEARLPRGCEAVRGDLARPGALVRAMAGSRYLVHVGALYSFDPGERRRLELVNVRGTEGLLEAARLAGVERAVVTSSSATVGPARGDRLADEADWADQATGRHGGYHESKLRQERVALSARLPVVSVLPTAPVGPGDWRPTPTGGIVLDYLRGRMFAYLRGGLNLVAVEDVAEGHVLALRRGSPGRRYLLGGENLTLLQVFEGLADITGVPAPRRRLPLGVAVAAARLDRWRCLAVPGARPRVPLEGVRMGAERMWVTCSRARGELGYAPRRSAAEALAGAVSWYREQGYAA